MPEHEIRFRAGWKLERLDEAGKTIREMIALPLDWTDVPARGVVRIVRSFQRPPVDPDTESVGLRISDAPGIVSLKLNGRPMSLVSNEFQNTLECVTESFAERRNTLEIEVDIAQASATKTWGKISLVIRREW